MNNRKALLIGVPYYRIDSVPNLPFIRKDFTRLQEALESSRYMVKVVGIDGIEHVSIGILRQEVYKFCREADNQDTLIILFSGHGLHYDGKSYLIPYDVDLSDPDIKRYLVCVDFNDLFEISKASTILFFIDACREGIDNGTKDIAFYCRWGEEKLNFTKQRKTAYIYACESGEVSRFVQGENGFSLFSHALAGVIHKNCPAKTFREVCGHLQKRILELADENEKEHQKIKIVCETTAVENSLNDEIICDAPSDAVVKVQFRENKWSAFVVEHSLWNNIQETNDSIIQGMKLQVSQLVEYCRRQWENAVELIPEDPWRDELLPIRTLERIDFLLTYLPQSSALSLAEKALLISSPFIREAVLASSVCKFSECEPYNLELKGITSGIRSQLEKTYLSNPQVVRKAEFLKQCGDKKGHDTIALWLMYQCLFRIPEVWILHPQGYVDKTLADAFQKINQSEIQAVKDTLFQDLLINLARCIYGDPERIERDDRPGAFLPENYAAGGTGTEQIIREKLLAYILALAGRMSFDVRASSELIIEHIGISDSIEVNEIIGTIQRAIWYPDGDGRSLKAECSHPALDIELKEQIQSANSILNIIHVKEHNKMDHLELLSNLPSRLTSQQIVPKMMNGGRTAYETPHVRFQLSQNETRELLMGKQLYGDPKFAIRELYQNALDACRYRLARTDYLSKSGKQIPKWQGEIVFRQGIENNRIFIECEDNGIGMGIREIKDAFACAGRRFADMPEYIEEQADWLRCEPPIRLYPNSQFGIGVFSYFMLSDEILVDTCRLDRSGVPARQRLEIRIAGSSSLFRTNSIANDRDAGTRIRLYLNNPKNEEEISCHETLKELLWVSQFKTTFTGGEIYEEWLPGVLKTEKRVFDTNEKDKSLWWVKKKKSYERKPGVLLSDGIVTEEQFPCAIVNLSEKSRPVLTIDRTHALKWDNEYVRTMVRNEAKALSGMESWVTYEWLWALEGYDYVAAEYVIGNLLTNNISVELLINEEDDIALPLQDVGCCLEDESVYRKLSSYKKEVSGDLKILEEIDKEIEVEERECGRINVEKESEIDHNENVDSKLSDLKEKRAMFVSSMGLRAKKRIEELCEPEIEWRSMPKQLLVYRLATWIKMLCERDVEHFKLLANAACEAGIKDVLHEEFSGIQAGDVMLLSRHINCSGPFFWESIPAIHILMSAYRLNVSPISIYRQLIRFEPLVKVPQNDWEKWSRNSLKDGDDIVLSENLNGKPEWINDNVQIKHIIKASEKLNESIGSILRRLTRFCKLGINIPAVEMGIFDNVFMQKGIGKIADEIIEPKWRTLYSDGCYSHGNVYLFGIMNASKKFKISIGEILRLLRPLRPFEIDVPMVEPELFDDIIPSGHELYAMNEYEDSVGVFMTPAKKMVIPVEFLKKAAEKYGTELESIKRDFERYSKLGLTIVDEVE